jgi:hypothetical protein
MVLESLEASKGSASSDHLMAEAGLVLLEVVVVVDLVIRVLALICWIVSNVSGWSAHRRRAPETHCEYVCDVKLGKEVVGGRKEVRLLEMCM